MSKQLVNMFFKSQICSKLVNIMLFGSSNKKGLVFGLKKFVKMFVFR